MCEWCAKMANSTSITFALMLQRPIWRFTNCLLCVLLLLSRLFFVVDAVVVVCFGFCFVSFGMGSHASYDQFMLLCDI